jgi:RimJ/RimL family protein N-acetyltransferase
MTSAYPPLNIRVRTPRLELLGATDDLLAQLLPVVRDGIVAGGPLPFDDPMSFYEASPEREWRWLRGIWAGRARVEPQWWRLYFAVVVAGEPVGMQDLVGADFHSFGTVSTFSWLRPSFRRRGVGREMRAAVLHLAFVGLGAKEALSEAFADNEASNRVSRVLGYEPNGTGWPPVETIQRRSLAGGSRELSGSGVGATTSNSRAWRSACPCSVSEKAPLTRDERPRARLGQCSGMSPDRPLASR